MSRVDETSPPGVSSRITSAEAFSCVALWIACETWRVVATPMTPFTSVTKTRLGDCALAGHATAAAKHSSTTPANHVGQACPVEHARDVKHATIGPSDEPSDGNASAAARAFQFSTNIGWRSPQGNARDCWYRDCWYRDCWYRDCWYRDCR
jgi:hypothetical protein